MDFELLNVFSGFQIGAKLNGRGDATTKLEMICLQVRKLNFLNEMQLGDFPVSHTTDDIIAFFFFLKKTMMFNVRCRACSFVHYRVDLK